MRKVSNFARDEKNCNERLVKYSYLAHYYRTHDPNVANIDVTSRAHYRYIHYIDF